MKRNKNFFGKHSFQSIRWTILQSVILPFCFSISSCSYNPFILNNHETGSATGVIAGGIAGGILGAGIKGMLGGSRGIIAVGAIGGGALGYYFTTLRYDAGGVIMAGGQVYKIGDFVGIYIPSDLLFEPNTADFLPRARCILDSVVDVLNRYCNHNILVSGNTSGFACAGWEQKLSERRAQRVAAYLWSAGVNSFQDKSIYMRKLNYVGYGDYLPIAHSYTNSSIRSNSRIQITAYPSNCDLFASRETLAVENVGRLNDYDSLEAPHCTQGSKGTCFGD